MDEETPEKDGQAEGEGQEQDQEAPQKEIKNSEVIQRRIEKQRKKNNKRRRLRHSMERYSREPELFGSIPNLRSTRKSPVFRSGF